MVHDALTSTFDGKHMVEQASFVSRDLGISRDVQDAWAFRSHQRAVAAIDAGRFADEIVAVGDLDADESPRRDTSLEKLASLKPVFDPEGTTTAGNAPGVNDGASCVLVASEEWAARRGIEPLATIVSQGYVADEFAYLARTPAKAAGIALAKAGKTISDVRRVEINEAFASVAAIRLGCSAPTRSRQRERRRRRARASGRRLGRKDPDHARLRAEAEGRRPRLAAICSGGGGGDALLIEV